MIIVLKARVQEKQIKEVTDKIAKMGLKPHVSRGVDRTIIGAIGDESKLKEDQLKAMPQVERVMPVMKPYKLVSREGTPENTVIKVGKVSIGSKQIVVIAGPCSVESEEQIISIAKAVKKAGATLLRGGAFKPRTSPYSFQGMGEEGLKLLEKAKKATGLPIVTEVMTIEDVPLVADYADVLQIGARNAQNYNLLRAVGKVDKPVLLKRGPASSLNEFLMAAEYILAEGNHKVMLCERGIRTFCTFTRNTLDLNIVPALKKETHLPVIVDPSHGTGRTDLVTPMALAGIAAGADGLIIEAHPNPPEAVSDGDQSLTPAQFANLMKAAKPVARAVGRTL
ncbi:MAG TPA: 3-deoxy-7-phosphoheptulonate synthase [Candidatus Nanoarchaeia archaeon]|nr:3-deoxy-7-phosphoheptulonate synthase [Candidatus Nanoarchaeia archaeon]